MAANTKNYPINKPAVALRRDGPPPPTWLNFTGTSQFV
jgi:hypothetical protein